jgi:hypothetical protein
LPFPSLLNPFINITATLYRIFSPMTCKKSWSLTVLWALTLIHTKNNSVRMHPFFCTLLWLLSSCSPSPTQWFLVPCPKHPWLHFNLWQLWKPPKLTDPTVLELGAALYSSILLWRHTA